MKYLWIFLFSSFTSLSFLQMTVPNLETGIQGSITEAATNEALIGATIKVLNKKNELVAGTVTDIDGKYRLETPAGVFSVQVQYTGFVSQEFREIEIKTGEIKEIDVALEASGALEEVVVMGYSVPKTRKKYHSKARMSERVDAAAPMPSTAPSITAEEIRDLPTRSVSVVAGKTAGISSDGVAISDKVSRDTPTEYSSEVPYETDEVMTDAYMEEHYEVAFDSETYEERIVKKSAEKREMEAKKDVAEKEMPGVVKQVKPRAGLLTAGEWNDLHNWKTFWTQQWADGEITAHSTQYGFFPEKRHTFMLANAQDVPMVDVPVFLKNKKGETVWAARTDNTGKAELWQGLFDKNANETDLEIYATLNGKTKKMGKAQRFEKGIQRLQQQAECAAPNAVDMVWVVDATGSMGDELEYLKTELLDVIKRVKGINPDLDIHTGSVFYRDKTDEYLVKASKLSSKIAETVDYIGKQQAQGGGDYPEAVDAALESAIFDQPWRNSARARICFLVLDASPHDTPEAKASIQKSIRAAAEKGIRLVPVAGSGIQKDTEYLMKFFGLATNGSYVFLTDHSGIGGKHLAPTTDEYKVEPLNDLLVRIITEYTTVEDCEGQSVIRFEKDPSQEQTDEAWAMNYFPNPASTFVTLDLPTKVQSVTLYDAEGKAVLKIENPGQGQTNLDVSGLPQGIYTMRIWKDGRYKTGKILVMRS